MNPASGLMVALVLALAAALPAAAADTYKIGALVIEKPFARPSMARNGAAYVTIVNTATQPDRLIRVLSPRSGKVEMHTMSMDGDIMRMREVPGIDVPGNGRVEMKPGDGLHIMLMGLNGPLNDGESFPMTLQFERSGKVDVVVPVEKPAPARKPAAQTPAAKKP
ncbi:MAG: copper chaperone PCu(A)C [Rhodospirillales bacterium]|nr:copper chaperone PCu(A)C [Rhodospirillales bacterium]